MFITRPTLRGSKRESKSLLPIRNYILDRFLNTMCSLKKKFKPIFIKNQNYVQYIGSTSLSVVHSCLLKIIFKFSDTDSYSSYHQNRENNFLTVLQGVYLKIGRDRSSEKLSPFYVLPNNIFLYKAFQL